MTSEIRNIQEAYMHMYNHMLLEEIHPELKQILDSNQTAHYNVKLSAFTKKVREHIKNGIDTGLENDKPLKGSSRAVFFPKDGKEIHIDGKPAKVKTAVKIAFQGQLDRHHGEETLLGEDQNQVESDHYLNSSYGVLRHTPEKGEGHYATNPHGILAPVFDSHHENHHLEMGRVEKFNANDFKEATKTKDFPKGITHKDFQGALEYHHDLMNGRKPYGKSEEHVEKISQHPYVESALSMMADSGMHPGDLSPRNMGIWHHPVTGTKHPVIIDWGFNKEIAQKYMKARTNKSKSKRGW